MHPIDLNSVKCRISEGCFFAIGSHARYKLEKVPLEDDCGTDFRLIRQINRNGRVCDMGTVLEFQLKATENWKRINGVIKYRLENKTYNDISSRNELGGTPLVLVVMLLPKSNKKWLNISNNQIIFKENLYWYYSSSVNIIKNEASKTTIEIPELNVLDDEAFHFLVKSYSTAKACI